MDKLPITKSRYLKYFTNEEQPYGENAIVAIMCYSGYNVEDAIIFNEGSLKEDYLIQLILICMKIMKNLQKSAAVKLIHNLWILKDNNVFGLREGYDYSKLTHLRINKRKY